MLDGLPNTQSTTPFRSSKRKRLLEVLTRHNGNKMAAARELGVARKTIYNWLNE